MSIQDPELAEALKRVSGWKFWRRNGNVVHESDEMVDLVLVADAYCAMKARVEELTESAANHEMAWYAAEQKLAKAEAERDQMKHLHSVGCPCAKDARDRVEKAEAELKFARELQHDSTGLPWSRRAADAEQALASERASAGEKDEIVRGVLNRMGGPTMTYSPENEVEE